MGITKTSSALSRWALSYNLRSQIADNTHSMFGLHQDSTPARKDLDKNHECSLLTIPLTPSSSSSTYFHHQNIQPVFITLPLKILSPMKFKSRC